MKKPALAVVIPKGADREIEVLSSLNNQSELNLELFVEIGPNISENRNNGAYKARSDLVAFVDAHSIVPQDWAEEIISFFKKNEKIDIVGGPQLPAPDESFVGKITGYALSSVFGSGGVSTRYKEKPEILNAGEYDLTSASLACRKKVFKKIKFDENFARAGEDIKFISDAKKAGLKIAYSPRLKVYHRRRATVRGFAAQMFNYARGRAKKDKLSDLIIKPSFIIPSLFVAYLIVLPFLILLNKLFFLPLLFYLSLSIIFSLYLGIKNRDLKSSFILPVIFFVLHISYGAGLIYSYFLKRK